ncbi:bile acid beta-glucosidase [Legionella santicrucis]|uniref:Bile acid beta-glucosidase n=1 Tax=Legionella santicrucis TaxID=45074 RepID=A0A0W0Z267_9GAMM|nr:bile acid beta-glucosidase [Legionella santicrucis]
MIKLSTLTIGLFLGQHAIAGLYIPGIVTPSMHGANNALDKAGLAEFHDEVTEDKDLQLNES